LAIWQRHIQIYQYGCFLGMKAVVLRSGGGSIVNISTVAGLKGSPRSFTYAATKWTLRGMSKSAAIDLGHRKIRVNSAHPGPIDTGMIAFRTPEQRDEHRYGTPEEVAQLVAFLLSDESTRCREHRLLLSCTAKRTAGRPHLRHQVPQKVCCTRSSGAGGAA
jgi:3alpha(or 20beta)-hydroxysteroid dehydrogenase